MKKEKLKVLDCTLRDGGYYNKWDFNKEIVERYLHSLASSKVDIIELGFRSLPKGVFMGPYIYTTDDFLEQIKIPTGPVYGVMINGKEFIDELGGNQSSIKDIFQHKKDSKITLVRIAINFDDVLLSKNLALEIKKLGYTVALNMMQSHGKATKQYIETSQEINNWNLYSILYFADSLGNMTPKDIKKICLSIKKGWSGPLGIHTHNNKNLALINSITAIENGVTWCDSTVNGMGRGAGNVSTENLLLEVSNLGYHRYKPKMMQSTVDDFAIMKNKYGWGSNLYYHYAANNNIHPTFVQSLLQDKRYKNEQVFSALEFLATQDSSSFSADVVRQAIYGNQDELSGSWDATDWLNEKHVLIVGAGKSVKKYKEGILQYINNNKPIVLFININRYLDPAIADATIVSDETRALFDSQFYNNLNHSIILPKARLGRLIQDQLDGLKILDYGLTLKNNEFSINANGCIIEWPLAAAYALAVVTQAGASKVNLVGFDGFNADDPRQEEMNNVFIKYSKLKKCLEISSLTPTSYRINQSSLFSPID